MMDIKGAYGLSEVPSILSGPLAGDMKLLVPILFAAAATVFAAVEPFSETEPPASVPAETPPAGVMRSGPLLPPLTPDEVNRNPVAVPERSVELRSESEEREDDPFDLPPEG